MVESCAMNHPGTGHRQRLRERFLQSGFVGFLDYEIVELLLTLGTPRKDCKKIAKEAIEKFGGVKEVLLASSQDLQSIRGIGPSNAFGLKLFQEVTERLAKEEIQQKPLLNSSSLAANFLQKSIGLEKKENFVILSLDAHHRLIKVSTISVGSLSTSVAHPREIFREAIQNLAAQIIVAHNHPSGNIEASPEDIALTRRLIEASKIFGIELLDHIIVTSDQYSSFKEQNLI